MRILVVTQKVDKDDAVLGFFFGWIEALATKYQEVTVICLERGTGSLPANVRVFSLGKENRMSRFYYVLNFYKYIFSQWNHYDSVFVHMNEEYVLLAGWLWRLSGKKILFWRNHAGGSFRTRLAVFFSDRVFCTSPNSYTARFKKTQLMPAGIDTDLFKPNPAVVAKLHSVLFLARMAPVKKPDMLIAALAALNSKSIDFSADFYGDALPKDKDYYESLKTSVRERELEENVFFYSGVPNTSTPQLYHSHTLFVNLTPSGSFDKTIVEAAAAGCLVLVANADLAGDIPVECITSADPAAIAIAVEYLLTLSPEKQRSIRMALQAFADKHSLNALMERLVVETPPAPPAARVNIFFRYVSAGVTGLAVNIGSVYILTHFFGVWYLLSSSIAFVISLFVSFTLQKFWTFKNRHMNVAGRQFLVYLSIALFNLLLNGLFVYFFTGVLGLWYVGSQILSSGLIGISSFFLYRAFVFRVPASTLPR